MFPPSGKYSTDRYFLISRALSTGNCKHCPVAREAVRRANETYHPVRTAMGHEDKQSFSISSAQIVELGLQTEVDANIAANEHLQQLRTSCFNGTGGEEYTDYKIGKTIMTCGATGEQFELETGKR